MQQVYLVKGVPVYVRHLPSGDMVVWHPFNEAVRVVVEPICQGNGYWQPEYKNWIIWKSRAYRILNELAKAGEKR